MSGLKVLALFGQLKHSRIDNSQTEILANELAKEGVLYKKEIFFNILINLPSFLLLFLPVWMLIKHMDDFREIDECDVIVVSGKKMIRFARHLRHYMFPATKIVQIGNPVCRIRKNDILVRQATSRFLFNGNNVIKVNGLLCKKIADKTAEYYSQKFDKIRNILKGEYIGVFIGGNKHRYKLTTEDAENLGKVISKISYNMKMPLLVNLEGKNSPASVSVLKNNLDCSYYFYEKKNDNESPKVAFMHWAKYYILFENSINDQSEYIAQKKPTYIYLKNKNRKKYLSFVNGVIASGGARMLSSGTESLDFFVPECLNDIEKIADKIKTML